MVRTPLLVAVALVLVLTSATAQGVSASAAPPDTAAAAALAKVRALFAEQCTRCHGIGRPAAGLGFSTDAELTALTETAVAGRDSTMLVVPGDLEASYLMMKIKGSDGITGHRMPLRAKVLSDADIGIVEEWIRSLAAPDTVAQPTAGGADSSGD